MEEDDDSGISDDDSTESSSSVDKPKRTEIVPEWDLLNGQKAIWLRAPKDVEQEEYNSFYGALSKVGPLLPVPTRPEYLSDYHRVCEHGSNSAGCMPSRSLPVRGLSVYCTNVAAAACHCCSSLQGEPVVRVMHSGRPTGGGCHPDGARPLQRRGRRRVPCDPVRPRQGAV